MLSQKHRRELEIIYFLDAVLEIIFIMENAANLPWDKTHIYYAFTLTMLCERVTGRVTIGYIHRKKLLCKCVLTLTT